jgi:hypothetical protein
MKTSLIIVVVAAGLVATLATVSVDACMNQRTAAALVANYFRRFPNLAQQFGATNPAGSMGQQQQMMPNQFGQQMMPGQQQQFMNPMNQQQQQLMPPQQQQMQQQTGPQQGTQPVPQQGTQPVPQQGTQRFDANGNPLP